MLLDCRMVVVFSWQLLSTNTKTVWDRCLGFKDPTFDLSPCTVSGGNQLLSLGNPVTSLTSRLHLAQQRHPKKQWGPKTISTEFGILFWGPIDFVFQLILFWNTSSILSFSSFDGIAIHDLSWRMPNKVDEQLVTRLANRRLFSWFVFKLFRPQMTRNTCNKQLYKQIRVYTLLPVNQVATHLNLSWFAWIFFLRFKSRPMFIHVHAIKTPLSVYASTWLHSTTLQVSSQSFWSPRFEDRMEEFIL